MQPATPFSKAFWASISLAVLSILLSSPDEHNLRFPIIAVTTVLLTWAVLRQCGSPIRVFGPWFSRILSLIPIWLPYLGGMIAYRVLNETGWNGLQIRDASSNGFIVMVSVAASGSQIALLRVYSARAKVGDVKHMPAIEIFVSHSSRDVELAKRVITLIRSALNVPSDRIRCTSVDGYRLPAGISTDDKLRQEIHESTAFVSIVTPASLKSTYVLFELGARWGARKPMIPLVGNGATPNSLHGPLAALNVLDCNSRAQLQQFVEDLGNMLNRKLDRAPAYDKCVEEIVQESKLAAISTPQPDSN